MRIISNTSPICYAILINQIDLFHELFDHIVIPVKVYEELSHIGSPYAVRQWILNSPNWLSIESVLSTEDLALSKLHAGERDVILLAEQTGADLLILDELAARQQAIQRGHRITGLIGILDEAASQGFIDFRQTIDDLQKTTFHISPKLIKQLLPKHP